MRRFGIFLSAGVFLAAALGAHAAQAETYTVKMKTDEATGDVVFEPANLKIQPGDTVVWVQDDADNEHNVAAYPSRIPANTEPFESPMMIELGATWSQTFEKPGSYFYHCHPHEAAGMRGLVIVGRPSLPEEFRRAKPGEMSHDHGDGGHHGGGDDMKKDMGGDDSHGGDHHDDGHGGDHHHD